VTAAPRKPDFYYRKAKAQGYAARSAFKLEELDRKYKLFSTGDCVIDLGAAPGSWLQFVSEKVGSEGKVLAVDRRDFRVSASNVDLICADVMKWTSDRAADSVISDLAPSTTGARDVDHIRSIELCRRAFEIARQSLKQGGKFVCKMFQGGESKAFLEELKPHFETVRTQKPEASRDESREVYVLGLHFRKS
jgi:23S rRNA (uridine2552-2'-O)-methyltransferase